AREVVRALLESGEVERSYTGIVPGPLQDLERFYEIGANEGMLVASVDPGSPAQRAGLRACYVVLTVDGKPLDGRFPEQLPPIRNRMASYPVGSEIELTVRRSGEAVPVRLKTEKLESRMGEDWAFENWGLTVRTVSRAFAREQNLREEGGFL